MQEQADFYTLVIIILFLMVLIFVAWVVKTKKLKIQSHIQKGQRIRLLNSSFLGNGQKATIFSVDNQEFLMVHGRGNSIALQPLSNSHNIEKIRVENSPLNKPIQDGGGLAAALAKRGLKR